MRVLLDTHLLLWALATPAKLPSGARERIIAADVYVSAASIWEISVKAALGKLDVDPREVLAAVSPAGFSLFPVTGEHAAQVVDLPPLHHDPFDRMLAAQASVEPMIPNDGSLAGYGSFVETF